MFRSEHRNAHECARLAQYFESAKDFLALRRACMEDRLDFRSLPVLGGGRELVTMLRYSTVQRFSPPNLDYNPLNGRALKNTR